MRSLKGEFCRYAGAGGVAFTADFCLLAVLNALGFHYLLAAILGFLLGTWVNYQLSVRWVFGHRALRAEKNLELTIFAVIGVISVAAGLAVIALMVEILDWDVLVAKGTATFGTLLLNFASRKFFLFTRKARFFEHFGWENPRS